MLSAKRIGIISMLVLPALLTNCSRSGILVQQETTLMQIPEGFPAMAFPEDNSYTKVRWLLGKRLFYDKALSRNNTLSCASCHRQAFAFSDTVAFSTGDAGALGTSNAPTLVNIGYHPNFTRAGGVPTLEMQMLVPIQEHNELNTSILDIVARLGADSSYQQMARTAYGRPLDPYVVTRAIACFERSLISGNSRFDQYYYQGNKRALSRTERRGMQLFFSDRTNCSRCHSSFNFTNYSFENNGLYAKYADTGRMRFTHLESDRARFKVPTLRNVALTAPYMHDGSLPTLEAVIAHYDAGGADHPNKSALIKPLHLSETEKKELVAFLKTLTDHELTTHKIFKE